MYRHCRLHTEALINAEYNSFVEDGDASAREISAPRAEIIFVYTIYRGIDYSVHKHLEYYYWICV